jgi:uncharacterized membrane protein
MDSEKQKTEMQNTNVKVVRLRWVLLGIIAAVILLLVIGVPALKGMYGKKPYYRYN